MNTFRTLWLGVLTCLLLACGGYDDDGGLKGGSSGGDGTDSDLESTEFFLAVTLPGGEAASAAQRPDSKASNATKDSKSSKAPNASQIKVSPRETVVNGLALENFSADVLVPDINEEDGFREVAVDVARFVDLGDGLYSVEIDGTPQVDTVIYVTVQEGVRLKVLALTAGSRSAPVKVNLQTTVAVDLFLEKVVEDDLNLGDLDIEDVKETFEDITEYVEEILVDKEIPDNVSDIGDFIDDITEEVQDDCDINLDGGGASTCAVAYRVGGTATGLAGSVTLALQNDEQITVTVDGAFAFGSSFPDATDYTVALISEPPLQTCVLTNASGTIAGADISNITLTCTDIPLYQVSGTATGVTGDVLILLNGQEPLTVSANGPFAFASELEDATPFTLNVVSSPAGHTCSLTPANGVIAGVDFTLAALDCAPIPSFTVGGSVTGVNGTVTLTLGGAVGPEVLPISANGSFVFTSSLLDTTAYNVVVTGQPATQSCSITQGTPSGVIAAASISDIVVTCVDNTYGLGGTISGLQGSVTLLLNGTESLPITTDGGFTFTTRLISGAPYVLTIDTQPSNQVCTIDAGGSGNVAGADVTTMAISCETNSYTVGGTITGLQGNARLMLNGLETLSVNTDGTYAFVTPVATGLPYKVALVQQPAGQRCALTNTTGTMGSANVTDVNASCLIQNLHIGGTATGLEGDLLLQLQSNTNFEVLETVVLNSSGTYQFNTLFGTGETYSVSITAQPAGLNCVIVNTTGTFASVDVGNVNLTCNTTDISPFFTIESARLVLPGEEIRLAGVALDDALFNIEGNNVTTLRQSYEYASFSAPSLTPGTHVVRAISSGGTHGQPLQWAQRMTGVASIAPGHSHACALQQDGSVLCWGDNGSGQLGNGDVQFLGRLAPDRVTGLTDAAQVASGAFFACARRQTGSVLCWGSNQNGELGAGAVDLSSVAPLTVSGIATAQQLSVGDSHACALLADQTVQCWGDNTYGQLGDGSTTDATTPVAVQGLAGVTAIAAGSSISCAILSDTTVRCWGDNGNGQLGNGTTTSSTAPVAVSSLTDVTSLAMGAAHVCALQASGNVMCWGANSGRQFGNVNFIDSFSSVPIAATGVSAVQALAAGQQHTCAVLSGGTVTCWGSQYNGEMGRGYYLTSADPVPAPVPGITTAIDVAASGTATCVVLADHGARCWGANIDGMLGRGILNGTEYRDYVYRKPVMTPMVVPGNFDAGYGSLCAVTAAQGVSCIGENDTGQLGAGITDLLSTTPVTVTGVGDASDVSVGQGHVCAVMQSGQVQCWGDGSVGQLGNGDVNSSGVPVTVTGITTAVEVAASGQHACAALQNGSVQCWGANYRGQLGAGTGIALPSLSNLPVTVASISDAVSVAVGAEYSCAIHATGTVSCWGGSDYGQLGNGTQADSSTPLAVPGITSAVSLSLARYHGCALLSNGNIQCWGAANSNSLLGDGSLGGFPRRPTLVKALPAPAVSVSAGVSHTCAVLNTGVVYCWGVDNSNEQLGDRPNQYGWPPVEVRGIVNATAVSVGDEYSCARLQDSSLHCWGLNRAQMGPGFAPVNADVRFVQENHTITVNVTGASDFFDLAINGIETVNVYNGETPFISTFLVGQTYTLTQVTTPAGQICQITNPTGTIASNDVTITVNCFADGNLATVTAASLTGFGLIVNLASITVDENLQFSGDGDYTFSARVPVGENYLFTFAQQPLGQTCAFTSGQGNSTGGISTLNVPIAVALTCVDLPFSVGGTLNGLQSGAVNLLFGGVEVLSQGANAPYTFDTSLPDGDLYNVGIVGQPPGQYCNILNSSGFIDSQSITNVDIQCVPQPYHLSGTISNLTGSLVLSSAQSGSNSDLERILRIATDSTFAFPNAYADGDSYYVSVVQQPEGQTCNVDTNFAGTFAGADITNVAISCVDSTDVPQIDSVAPAVVLPAERVTLRGNFLAGVSVTVNGQSVTPLTQSNRHFEFAAPTLPTGNYPVVVSNTNGTDNDSISYGQEFNNIANIEGGSEFTCLRQQDSTVRCFGYNGQGQLGLGNITLPNGIAVTPLTIDGLTGSTAISLGASHACAVNTLNQVLCWGSNAYGELGKGDNNNALLPNLLVGLSATQVSAGGSHTCAVTTGARNVYCWGSNFNGELGDGTTNASNVPNQVPNLSGVIMVAAGDAHTCALLASPGGVRCWGYNGDGRLGDGTTNSSLVPVDVSGITDAVSIVAGTTHNCALLATGEVNCWGRNDRKQLGNAAITTGFSSTPVSVGETAQAPVSNLVAGATFNCAVSDTNTVLCWGDNNHGALGDGSGLSSAQPVEVVTVGNVASLGAGYFHACAVLTDGNARCWGQGFNGELGNGQAETIENYVYVKPIMTAFDSIGVVTQFSTGLKHACAVIGGAVYCVGTNGSGQLGNGSRLDSAVPVAAVGLTDAQVVHAGFEHTCALRSTGTVMCWGANDFGQLGAGLIVGDATTPVPVNGISGVTRLTAGYRHNCAIVGSGSVYCWGNNNNGGLGVGVMGGQRNVPVQVRDLANATEIDASGSEGTTCARLNSGQVACWGSNDGGGLGNGSFVNSALPIVIPSLSNIVSISTGGLNRINDFDDINPTSTNCAIDTAGAVFCWGAGSAGQLGLGGGLGARAVPVRVSLSRPALSIDAGGAHACAVLNDNTVNCWGSNNAGQLGIGVDNSEQRLPTPMPGLSSATQLSTGRAYTCALLTGGDMQCWGENGWAQMGSGLTDITRRLRYVP